MDASKEMLLHINKGDDTIDVRHLFIPKISPGTYHEVAHYFLRFGDASITIFKADQCTGARILFDSKEDAAKVLTTSTFHVIGNQLVKIYVQGERENRVYRQWKLQMEQVIKFMLANMDIKSDNTVKEPVKMIVQSDKTMMDLNDDCILEIMDRLNYIDLLKVAKVNKRLESIVFSLFTDKNITLYFYNESDVALILHTFGRMISGLAIGNILWQDLIPVAHQHCSGTLRNLTLRSYSYRLIYDLKKYQTLFEPLTHLTLDNCFLMTTFMVKLLHAAKCLKSLKIRDIYWPNEDLLVNEHFRCTESVNNPVETLEITNCKGLSDRICFIFANKLVNLKELIIRSCTFTTFTTVVSCIPKHKLLEKLDVDCNWECATDIAKLLIGLQANSSMNHLSLANFEATDDVVCAMHKILNLKTLKLINVTSFTENYFNDIGQNLSKLEEIHLIECKPIAKVRRFKLADCTKAKILIN